MAGQPIEMMVVDPLDLAMLKCNDYGNALRFEAHAGGLLKWVDDEYWSAFDDKRWSSRDGEYRATALAHRVAEHIQAEARALGELVGDPEKPDEAALRGHYGDWISGKLAVERLAMLHKHAITSGNASQTRAMINQAKALEKIRARGEDFNRDPLSYNVQNGTLRFFKGPDGWAVRFREGHDPRDMITQIANVEYDPKATCADWERRLELVQPNPEQRAVLPRLYGQTLTGLTDSEEFYVHQGRGGDGKTKSHEVLGDMHGDYYRHAGVKTFLEGPQKGGAEHRSDLTRLSGDIRMVCCDEPKYGAVWDSETIKQITGGVVTARAPNAREEITYKPSWKLFVEVNPLPRAPGDDKGFRRSFKLFLWQVDLSKIEGGYEPREVLLARLTAEKSGILNWLIKGCLEWLADRRIPETSLMTEALTNYWSESSPMGEWIEEACDLSQPQATTPSTSLYAEFKKWCEAQGLEKVPTQTSFGRKLTEMQIMNTKDGQGRKVRRGICLRPAFGGPASSRGDGGRASEGSGAEPQAPRSDDGYDPRDDYNPFDGGGA